MTRTAILGIGSPFGDDRAGWLVIDALDAAAGAAERAAAGVTTVALDRPGIALLDHLRGVERAVLVDALHGAAAPGTIVMLDAAQLQPDGRVSTHGVGVAEALALGATLRMLPPDLELFGIAVDPARTDTVVSILVRRAARRLARSLQRWLDQGGSVRDHVICAPMADPAPIGRNH